LPSLAEHVQALKFRDTWVDIPGSGNGGSLGERGAVIVNGKYLLDGRLHGLDFSHLGVYMFVRFSVAEL